MGWLWSPPFLIVVGCVTPLRRRQRRGLPCIVHPSPLQHFSPRDGISGARDGRASRRRPGTDRARDARAPPNRETLRATLDEARTIKVAARTEPVRSPHPWGSGGIPAAATEPVRFSPFRGLAWLVPGRGARSVPGRRRVRRRTAAGSGCPLWTRTAATDERRRRRLAPLASPGRLASAVLASLAAVPPGEHRNSLRCPDAARPEPPSSDCVPAGEWP